MNRLAKNIMNMGRPKRSRTRGLALFALGAAVGAGVAMWRDQRPNYEIIDEGEGPVEVDL